MRIVAADARTVRLSAPVRNSAIDFEDMTASALVLRTDARRHGKSVVGLAFDSIGRYDHSGLLRDRFVPRLLAADPRDYADDDGGIDPSRVWAILMKNEKPGGHGERCGAVGLIDAALWDLAAKRAEVPLWHYLSRLEGAEGPPTAAVYVSGGHYRAENDVECLCEDVRRAMADGHRRFKIKIGGKEMGADLKRIEAVLRILEPQMHLAVDANSGFDLDNALNCVEALGSYPLMWLEEPLNPLDYESHRELAARSKMPLAVGENLFSVDDARNLLRYGGLRRDRDLLQFDISLSYGIVEYRRILVELAEQGWQRSQCAPHAGHLLAFNAVAGLGLGIAEAAMDTTSLFGRLTSGIEIAAGTARLPEAVGTGFEETSVYAEIFGELLN
ncbi:MAG: enolase C-terminal domain-like protein [Xanthobacteraceae bacterium]|jgi:L-alanine-DL-glutamate epimerase-like enolase superfamily enzyme